MDNKRIQSNSFKATMGSGALHLPPRNLGLDLDGTITECPDYFKTLTHIWPGRIYVVTYRKDFKKAREDVESFGIRYHEIILVDSLEAKASVIEKNNITVFYDDQPETIIAVPGDVQVFLVRNGGNFDYESRRWIMSDKTAEII